ncbi:MAG: thrombospondin type 3 repeat-containing protein, partial [Gammaproteobacteria bacterium]
MKYNNNKSGVVNVFIYATFFMYCLAFLFGCGSTAPRESAAVTGQSASASTANEPQGESNTAALLDDDNDGVINADDQCKKTEPNTWVDIKGCALDTDGDSIADSRDACRGTPRGVKVDGRGCGFDDDHDGVPNFRDRCSNTIADVSVDGNGCEWDSDNDGIVDSKD